MPDLLSAAEAAAHAARLSQASVLFAPSPLSSGMLEKSGLPVTEYESHASALSAAMSASAFGKRVFVPLSVRSLNEFYSASFQRLPIVAANISHCMSVHSTRSDLNDIMSLRDSGWMIFLAQSNQEVLDSILMAYKISEEVLLPSVVNINGLDLREPVAVPGDKKLLNLLGKPRARDLRKPEAINPPMDDYAEFSSRQQAAMNAALAATEKTCMKWKEKFGRSYGSVEKYMMDDADYAFVVAGSSSLTCRAAVEKLRAQGEKAGMLRIRMLRPFPAGAIADALKSVRKAAILDESMSLGLSGILNAEISQCYRGFSCNYICLGKQLTERAFAEIFAHLKNSSAQERMWL